ncbi:MAG: hypothetical protein JO355_01295 [Planctomycetaceae bacterium]|nr:hypothetical protein [Planctomycetaceae bacterium]
MRETRRSPGFDGDKWHVRGRRQRRLDEGRVGVLQQVTGQSAREILIINGSTPG